MLPKTYDSTGVLTMVLGCGAGGLDALEAIKDNDEAVKVYGIQLGTDMCKQLLDAGTLCLYLCL
jgi:hypothetical protein